MLLRSVERLLKPSAFCLGCHPFLRTLPWTLSIQYQAPLFALYDRGCPSLILRKDRLVPPIANCSPINQQISNQIVERENIWTVPNILCLTRIIVTPYLGHLILNADFLQAFYIMVFAGMTDLLDGFIARTWYGQASKLGSFLDPMADKILIVTLFATMTYSNLIPAILTGLIITRDVSLAGAAFYIRYMSLPPPRTLPRYFDMTHATAQLAPTTISKFNTVVQLLTVAITLTASAFNFADHPIVPCCWGLTAATTIASAASYIISKNTYKILKNSSANLKKYGQKRS
uniref:cardiolipin synthase (CMP-forming) n=1 Tax=Rhodnius prolixus TaxID=13249 RepID=T1HZB5_RHOPR